ncbi:MAG TPA: hypothetical protein VM347_30465 [Nonomuraea sp.]|nr:hypothetical protein [Nonomuraea sp.]
MTVRPSETSEGQQWLTNFAVDEQHAAALLLDSLRVISSSRFRIAMLEALDAAISEFDGPVGMYPVRELITDGKHDFPPLDEPYVATPGSEGIAGNVIRDVIGRWPVPDRAASYPSLEELRDRRVRTLLMVDDYSGTGNQVAQYVDAWLAHPTIKSWHSYGFVRVHVLLLAASASAQQTLQDHRFITSVRHLERGLGFDTVPWTEEERAAIVELCRRHALNRRYALGYGGTAGLLAFHHTVPNNLPQILWQAPGKKRPDWVPLFGDRRMSAQFQAEVDDYRPETDPQRIATIIRQERLGKALDGRTSATARNFLLVLGAIEKGYREPERLSDLLGFSLTTTRRTLEACQALKLLDGAHRLTTAGHAELRHARNRPPLPEPGFPDAGSDDPYYPRSLRGAK